MKDYTNLKTFTDIDICCSRLLNEYASPRTSNTFEYTKSLLLLLDQAILIGKELDRKVDRLENDILRSRTVYR